MEYMKLSNGVEMPLLGYGVFQVSPEECERCVADALSVGYRLVDTAQAYFNEEGVGNAWRKSGLRREDLFLVTKVWISNNGEERAARSIDESLRKLQTEYKRGIVAIPKSTHRERMAQNLDVFDFALSADEMGQIAAMNQHDAGTVNFGDPQFVKYLISNYG
ncbi:MAG: aldo/keto reductase [Bacteroidales bacterium]|nr:aldo/keto reductase [Bacteroidales bacterium]